MMCCFTHCGELGEMCSQNLVVVRIAVGKFLDKSAYVSIHSLSSHKSHGHGTDRTILRRFVEVSHRPARTMHTGRRPSLTTQYRNFSPASTFFFQSPTSSWSHPQAIRCSTMRLKCCSFEGSQGTNSTFGDLESPFCPCIAIVKAMLSEKGTKEGDVVGRLKSYNMLR